ncbi:hypothetical protein CANARDRAFT_6137 [[Candida] arabinofermentans NRRL YB-2248]|uniref:Cytochrome b-c1 complex subunit 10 n=1 Tax=[Candida] arabinofermentans NRRL YB-2248 TaxID=983967 RepID=A0A1E4T783_9ASCO|nr:hypothetical protein CANARDRAFT_6137 [[Candida] arabinofermentans NRRL YB-2248]
MVNYIKSLKFTKVPHIGIFNPTNVLASAPALTFWGGAAFMGIFVFTENWPLFQDVFFKKIPYFGNHWVKEVDPQDQPQ